MCTYHPEALAANLYGMRSAAGMSLKELAQHVGIGHATLCGMENCYYRQRCPNLSTICAIADYFGVSLDWLCGRVRTEKTPAPAATDDGDLDKK